MEKIKYVFIVLCTMLVSCNKGIFDAGKTITKTINLPSDIWVAEIQNIFEIVLINDSLNFAEIVCGENLIDDVHIKTEDHILYLNHTVSYNWSRTYEKVKIHLHLKTIPRLNIREPVLITTQDTIKTERFDVVVWCQFSEINAAFNATSCELIMSLNDFGKYVFKGNCDIASLNPAGSGIVDCRGLKTNTCKIWQRSIADSYINVNKKLIVEFKDRGNIYYSGNPDSIILLNQPNIGKLIKSAP